MTDLGWALKRPGVESAVAEARDACATLRWHQALRRRQAECQLEAQVRAAQASVALEGVELPVAAVRDLARGAVTPQDAAAQLVLGAFRAQVLVPRLATEQAKALRRALPQALAQLHLAVASGVLPEDALGRPAGSLEAEPRLGALAELLQQGAMEPGPLVAAVLVGEVSTLGLFPGFDGLVGRALGRAWLVGSGVEPTGVGVPEAAWASAPGEYALALDGYRSGTAEGVAEWMVTFCKGVARGATQGGEVCDSVLLGRFV